MYLFRCLLVCFSQQSNVWSQCCRQFRLRDATDGRELRQHRNIIEIIDGRENAQLREFRNARDEAETDHRLTGFQRLIEFLHNPTKAIEDL